MRLVRFYGLSTIVFDRLSLAAPSFVRKRALSNGTKARQRTLHITFRHWLFMLFEGVIMVARVFSYDQKRGVKGSVSFTDVLAIAGAAVPLATLARRRLTLRLVCKDLFDGSNLS